jgi:hypothetical protein
MHSDTKSSICRIWKHGENKENLSLSTKCNKILRAMLVECGNMMKARKEPGDGHTCAQHSHGEETGCQLHRW